MSGRCARLWREVHALARAYHWSERELLAMPLHRRLRYLLLLEEEADARLLGGIPAADQPP